ncbi:MULTISPECIES: hypothetical protein [unclassified Cryobacterium]|uniref:hypothetical protein n=1 Tax=unclassified Cryobacterium TaxID=2649013 RepID=UPI002AB40C5D|nr:MULTISPECIES: hypothetical protein [unclassified Cryobacterium]MDY7541203.1 hypothetical protein [Cryobacterium sp. 5B3]MEB0000063.1 hypothetical protein [Cryobacterium sp. RTS3]MEB0267262.1 hypothetical protein [Cryobacterium sp. 10I5]MEB0275601.1 hypothetical protein [Cryobacterium sp. 5B3]
MSWTTVRISHALITLALTATALAAPAMTAHASAAHALTARAADPPYALPAQPLFVFAAYFAVVLLSVVLPFAGSFVVFEVLQLWVARRRGRAEPDLRTLLLTTFFAVALGAIGVLLLRFGLSGVPPESGMAASLGGFSQRLLIVFAPLAVVVLVLRALIDRRRPPS